MFLPNNHGGDFVNFLSNFIKYKELTKKKKKNHPFISLFTLKYIIYLISLSISLTNKLAWKMQFSWVNTSVWDPLTS